MKDTRKRKAQYKKQLETLDKKNSLEEIVIEEDELYNEAVEVIKTLDFSDKFKTVRDFVDKIVLKKRSGVEVWAHIELPQITEKLGSFDLTQDYNMNLSVGTGRMKP